jgi:hypothetical protein
VNRNKGVKISPQPFTVKAEDVPLGTDGQVSCTIHELFPRRDRDTNKSTTLHSQRHTSEARNIVCFHKVIVEEGETLRKHRKREGRKTW